MSSTKPQAILIVLDGWGYSPNPNGNAILLAQKPNFDYFWQNYPHTLLSASGEEVGLPWGEIGSSEVGHLTIGAGRVIYQELPRVTRAIRDGSFYNNACFNETIDHAKRHKSALHLIGLVSSGGVHSHIDHLFALLTLIKKKKFSGPSYIHIITDGRDTPPKSAHFFIGKLENYIKSLHLPTRIATVSGRYFAMDRDSHWDRTMSAYQAIVNGQGQTAPSPMAAVDLAYTRGETDEFIKPTVLVGQPAPTFFQKIFSSSRAEPKQPAQPVAPVGDNDAVIFFNFRPDRMRQLVELFLFPRQDVANTVRKNLDVATMTQYSDQSPAKAALPSENVTNPIAKIFSDHHLNQLHIAETEKYAHVTYFFDGGHPQPNPGEKWILIPSPKVPTLDLQPAMSAAGIVDTVINLNSQNPFDFVLINFANADMVGHTGNIEATIKAVEAIDVQLGRLRLAFPDTYFFITADHGNAEVMIDPQTGEIDTEHSLNPVPFIAVHESLKLSAPPETVSQASGILADIAPTILSIYSLKPAPEMTGYNLLTSLSPTRHSLITTQEATAAAK